MLTISSDIASFILFSITKLVVYLNDFLPLLVASFPVTFALFSRHSVHHIPVSRTIAMFCRKQLSQCHPDHRHEELSIKHTTSCWAQQLLDWTRQETHRPQNAARSLRLRVHLVWEEGHLRWTQPASLALTPTPCTALHDREWISRKSSPFRNNWIK